MHLLYVPVHFFHTCLFICSYVPVHFFIRTCAFVHTCLCICSYMPVHLFICACAFVHMCLFICAYTSGGQRSTLNTFLPPFSNLLLTTWSLTKPGACWLARIARQQAPGVLLSLSPQHWGYRYEAPDMDFIRMLGIEDKSPCSCGKYFTAWVSSPGLHSSYLVKIHLP